MSKKSEENQKTSYNFTPNMNKALIMDVLFTMGTKGVMSISDTWRVFSGAFTAYTIREIARDFSYPLLGGAVAGAIKYVNRDISPNIKFSVPVLGALNNWCYEFAMDKKIDASIATIGIETFIGALDSSSKAYNNNLSLSEALSTVTEGALKGCIGGAAKLGLKEVFFEPLKEKKLPTLVATCFTALALLSCVNNISSRYDILNTLVIMGVLGYGLKYIVNIANLPTPKFDELMTSINTKMNLSTISYFLIPASAKHSNLCTSPFTPQLPRTNPNTTKWTRLVGEQPRIQQADIGRK